MINAIKVRGAKVHNLKNIDVNIPLHKIVGSPGCPALENRRLHWASCTRRAPGGIWRRFPPIRDGG